MTTYSSEPTVRSSRATLKYPAMVDYSNDANRINEACKGLGTKEAVITEILGHRSLEQRLNIRQAYQEKFGKDLLQLMASELSGDYENLVESLLVYPLKLLAKQIYKAFSGRTSHRTLTDILCCCDQAEMYMLKKAYNEVLRTETHGKVSNRSLEGDIKKHTKGHYQALLLAVTRTERCATDEEERRLLQSHGIIEGTVDENLVAADVKQLREALMKGTKSGGKCGHAQIDATTIIGILTKRSALQMRQIWKAYLKTYGTNLVQDIKSKVPEPLRTGLNTLIMAKVDLSLLLVCQLFEAMYGHGTNENTLIRIICLHAEHDMLDLVQDYQKYFQESFVNTVKADTSGDFRNLLMELLGNKAC